MGKAILSLPHAVTDETGGSKSSSPSPSPTAGKSRSTFFGSKNKLPNLVTFLEVAAGNLSDIQLIDSVHLDVLTGKATFLLYTSAVDTGSGAWVLLLDAARGMMPVASPIPVEELQRCAL